MLEINIERFNKFKTSKNNLVFLGRDMELFFMYIDVTKRND